MKQDRPRTPLPKQSRQTPLHILPAILRKSTAAVKMRSLSPQTQDTDLLLVLPGQSDPLPLLLGVCHFLRPANVVNLKTQQVFGPVLVAV
jgi:hypothetical protein